MISIKDKQKYLKEIYETWNINSMELDGTFLQARHMAWLSFLDLESFEKHHNLHYDFGISFIHKK